jgi:hypothetical protein
MTRRLMVFDWPACWFNLAFLFAMCLTPFSSALLGEAGAPGPAWSIYCALLILIAVTQTLFCAVINRGDGRLKGGMNKRVQYYFLMRASSPGIAFAVGLALMQSSDPGLHRASLFCWVLIPVLMALAGLIFRPSAAELRTMLPLKQKRAASDV